MSALTQITNRLRSKSLNGSSRLVARFLRDDVGAYAIIFALSAPALIGAAGLAAEGGLWLYKHESIQGAADSAALSAANAYGSNLTVNLNTQADGVTAAYGYSAGAGGNTVTVNHPPATGHYAGNNNAIEVIVTVQQPRLLSAIFTSTPVAITARAVAVPGNGGNGCVLALNPTAAAAVNAQGNVSITLSSCSIYDDSSSTSGLNAGGTAAVAAQAAYVVGNVSGSANFTTTDGITTGASSVADPYNSVAAPTYSGCNSTNLQIHNTQTLSPGVLCGGLQLTSGANVTLNPGVYILDGGNLQVAGGATLTGSGVTLYFTSHTGSGYANATINGGATVNLTAPTTGPDAGIVFFGDRNMPINTTFKFNGGSGQVVGGAIYVPSGTVQYAGGAQAATVCTQVVADTVSFVGNAVLANNCSSYGTNSIGSSNAKLVE